MTFHHTRFSIRCNSGNEKPPPVLTEAALVFRMLPTRIMSNNVGKFFFAANDKEERVCVISEELDDYLLILSDDDDEGKWISASQWDQLEGLLNEGSVPSKKFREIIGDIQGRNKDFRHLDAKPGGRLNAKTIESEKDGHRSIRLDWNSMSGLAELSD